MLLELTRETADAILAVAADGQFGPFLIHDREDDAGNGMRVNEGVLTV